MVRHPRHHDGRFAKVGEVVSARAQLEAKQAKLAAREVGSSKGGTVPPTLHALFSSYLSHLERKGDKDETVKRNRHTLVRHGAWLNEVGVEPTKVTELVIEEYFAWLDGAVEQTTANREAGMVKAAYRYAVRIGMIKKNPAEYVKAPSVDEAEPAVYTNEELRRIRAALRTDLEEAIFYGFAYTGLRRCELCKLKPKAHADIDRKGNKVNYVDFEHQEIKVIGKGGKFRKLPLHPTLAEVWAAHLRRNPGSKTILGKGGSKRNVNERVEQLLRRARVDGGSRPAHKFRATVQTVLWEEGVPTDTIDKMLGWAPSSVRQRYYSRIRDEVMYEAILKLYASDPIERAPLDAQASIIEASDDVAA